MIKNSSSVTDSDLRNLIIENLHLLLADYNIFYTNLRGLNWCIKGGNLFEVEDLYINNYIEVAEIIDEIAETIILLGERPENRFSEYLKCSSVEEINNVTDCERGIRNIQQTCRMIMEKTQALYDDAMKARDVATLCLAKKMIKTLRNKESLDVHKLLSFK